MLNLLAKLPPVTGEEVHSVFDVIHTETKKTYQVYAVEGTMFLIYIEEKEDPHWEWRDMTEFKPADKPEVLQTKNRRNLL